MNSLSKNSLELDPPSYLGPWTQFWLTMCI